MKKKKIDVKQVIVVRKDLNMRKGKLAAQVGHATMMFILKGNTSNDHSVIEVSLNEVEREWIHSGHTKIVCGVNSKDELLELIKVAKKRNVQCHAVTDAGRTEFKGIPTLTCAAFGPDDSDELDKITGHLKPL